MARLHAIERVLGVQALTRERAQRIEHAERAPQ